jgi:hypothetical protein
MATTEQRAHERGEGERNRNLDAQQRETFHAIIAEQVMHRLGQPRNLIDVQVRPLWANRFRVNVFVGADVTSPRVANSYFLVIDNNGNITEATPAITKQY